MSGTTSPSYNHDFFVETLGLSQEILSDIIYSLQDMQNKATEEEHFLNQRITKLSLDISQFVEITSLLCKAIMTKKQKSIKDFKESHIQLFFIMKAINQAQLKSDVLALEELIKYELKDNLTQWKIDLFPQVRKLLNS